MFGFFEPTPEEVIKTSRELYNRAIKINKEKEENRVDEEKRKKIQDLTIERLELEIKSLRNK